MIAIDWFIRWRQYYLQLFDIAILPVTTITLHFTVYSNVIHDKKSCLSSWLTKKIPIGIAIATVGASLVSLYTKRQVWASMHTCRHIYNCRCFILGKVGVMHAREQLAK